MSYCESVVAAVERRAAGRAVTRVGVRIGVVHRVVADAFQQSFELAAAGGVAVGAVTELVTVPVTGTCRDCRTGFTSDDPAPACPRCGSLDVFAEGGDEVVLEWIAYRATEERGESDAESADELVPEHRHDHDPAVTGAG
jgi:Zn finger protein HypA/HybF involved in hydrogenase expression